MADTRITIDAQIQMRHDTEANWMAADPVLRVGEPAYTIGMPDRFKIGDGQRKWSELPYLTMLEEDPEGPALPALGELADVEIEQPVEGQALVYDEVRGMWVNRAVSAPDDEPESGPVFEFVYDSATNKATAEMVAALAEAIAANKLILCNGRTYKFILEQDGMYGLVSDAYMDIMDGKLKASVLAVMSSSYDVQLMEEEVPVGTEITEATISGWGFTKNQGTITGIKMNGATKGTSGVVDLGNVLTEHQKLKTINGESIVGEGNIIIQGGGATPRVEMTAESASIEPNKFYVWPMMDSLDLTLGAEQSGVMNRYLFQFRNPKAGLTMLTLPDTITWSEDTELDENGMPVMEAAAFYRIEIIEGLASLKKWKLVYINFADAEVERVLMANGIGDGIGITKRDAARADTSVMDSAFYANSIIEEFDEYQFFTSVQKILIGALSLNSKAGFKNCTALRNITLPSSCIELGSGSPTEYSGVGAFYGCTSLERVSGATQLVKIGACSFYNCSALKSIDLRDVAEIGRMAFYNCANLALDVTGLFGEVTILPLGTFYNTKVTGDLAMPMLESIPYGYVVRQAFELANLKRILNLGKITEIPSGYNNNYPGVFGKNYNLTLAILPDTLESIGNRTFHADSKLEVVVCKAITPPSLDSTAFNSTNSTFVIYVPDTSVEAYKTAQNWNTYAARVKGISDLATDNPALYAEIEQYL